MRALVGTALLIIAAASLAPLASAKPTNTAATEFVRRHHLGSNLKTMAFATAQKTQTFGMLASEMGTLEARRVVSKELDKHAHQFQGKWDTNLAKAYAQNFTPEELASLASEGRNSRYVRKLSEKQNAVGESMQRVSKPILTEYVTTAMTSAFFKMPPR